MIAILSTSSKKLSKPMIKYDNKNITRFGLQIVRENRQSFLSTFLLSVVNNKFTVGYAKLTCSLWYYCGGLITT